MSFERVYRLPVLIISNLGAIFHRFRDIDNFPLKNTFLPLLHSTANLKMYPLHCIAQFLHAESFDTRLIIRVKSFLSYEPRHIHNTAVTA